MKNEVKTASQLSDYFPEVSLPIQPFQDWCVVQMKKSLTEMKTSGGIILTVSKTDDEKNQEEWHETLGKVLAIGPVFQRNRETLEPWPEGLTVKVGDIVRIPEFVSGRFTVKATNGDEIKCIFVRDAQLMGGTIGDPLDTINRVKSYVPLTQRKING